MPTQHEAILYVDALLKDLERLLGVTIVVHDRAGILRDREGRPLLPGGFHHHRHEFCQSERNSRYDYHHQCLGHCLRDVNEMASRTREPFVHNCWKGAAEVVVPVYYDQIHVMTVFAGLFRGKGRQGKALPVLSKEQEITIGRILRNVFYGLLSTLQIELRPQAGRRELVLHFIRMNAHRKPKLSELARELSLSVSRTSHLMQDMFGKSFQEMMTESRLNRARELLADTTYTIERIALSLGFNNPGYLHRLFRREFGMTPRDYRCRHAHR